ncbi:MAG: TetR family transcriptional regulator [Candidatus Odyssella sp.]|nr:TetR family transcriptional regulator [Candidatus Odyssella sp.]
MAAKQTKTRPPRTASRPPRRSQEERRETTRRQLLDAAILRISRRGLTEASLDAIADAARVTRGAVQHHFGTRNDLLLAVVDEFGRELFALVSDPAMASRTLAERIEYVCGRYWATFSGDHFRAVIQIWLGTQAQPRAYRKILDRIRWFERELDRHWLTLFGESGLDAPQLAAVRHVALATMRGLALRAIYSNGKEDARNEIAVLKAMLSGFLATERGAAARR